MTGWNLPPGCSVSDLPGNQESWEEIFEAHLMKEQHKDALEAWIDLTDDEWQKLSPLFNEIMVWATGIGYQDGLSEAQMRADMEAAGIEY
jgi:hypothetical protein